MSPSEGQGLQELGMKTALEVEGCSGLRRPTKALLHPMNACNLRLTGGGGRERAPGGFWMPPLPWYFMERSHLIPPQTSPFILTGELQCLRSFVSSFLLSPCAAQSPGTKNSPNRSFLLQQRDLMGTFSPVQAQGFGTSDPLESLFSYRAHSAPGLQNVLWLSEREQKNHSIMN